MGSRYSDRRAGGRTRRFARGGIAAGLLAVLVVCGGCGHVPLDYPRTASFAVRSSEETELGRAVAPQAAAHPGESGLLLLPTGPDALVARVAMVEMAQKSLDLQYFMWEDDLVGDLLLDRVLNAADRGVRVRLLLDDFYQLGRDKRWAAVDTHPNIEVRLFNPLGGSRTSKFSRSMNYALGPKRNRGRMHNKELVVDGAAVVVGGRNIADEYFAASEEYNFADQDLLAIGPAAREASDVFDQYWNSPVAIPVEAFAKGDSKMLDEVRAEAARRIEAARDSVYATRLRDSHLVDEVRDHSVPWIWAEAEELADDPGKSLLDIKDKPGAFMETRLAAALESARHEVLMVSPYFVAGPWGVDWLRRAQERGVDVKLITNSLGSNDVAAAHGGYAHCRKDVLRAGLEVYELRAEPERTEADVRRYGNEVKNALHAKILILDREWLFVGSFNLDPRAVKLDSQNGMLIHNPQLAAQLAGRFEAATSPAYTYRVTLNEEKLTWTCQKAGQTVEYHEDPGTSAAQRFKASLLATLAPEKWL